MSYTLTHDYLCISWPVFNAYLCTRIVKCYQIFFETEYCEQDTYVESLAYKIRMLSMFSDLP